ncbi:MAG: hypothetical protein A2086_13120 [Spirochaetes bacterium GWD1_27_9]|nr:MAG: hypothetical protein A2Y34_18095 [Spirochaetes bacterium GWC1_27_15]OHD43602.1 MAG: hypothetical protein A2086_13120 [Spirochaetes bacterium GWD1_27_9]
MNLDWIYIPKNNKFNIIFFAIITVITIILGIGIANLEPDNDVTVLLPVNAETEDEREKIARLNKEFPSDQVIFISVLDNPFTPDKIKPLWEMCNELEKLNAVKSTLHPFNATYFNKIGTAFSITKLNSRNYPKTQEEINILLKNLTSNRYLVGSVISYDHNSAGVVVRMNYNATIGKDIENPSIFIKFFQKAFGKTFGKRKLERTDFCGEVESVIKKYDKHFKIYYAGVPVYEAKTKIYMLRDLIILLGPAILLMIFSLYMSFKTARGTFLPMLAMCLSLIWTLGVLGWLRMKLTIVGILMPPIILTVGSSYTLHYLNSYYHNSPLFSDKSRRNLIISSTREILPTISMASLTTIVGFASFFTVSIRVIREFGIIVIISIFFTLFFTFFLLSKVLSYFKIPHNMKLEEVKNDKFAQILKFLNELVYPLRYLWLGIFFLCIILFLIFIPRLKVETNAASFFKESDNVKKSLLFLQENFGGSTFYNITIRSVENKRNFFKSKEGLLSAKKIQEYFDKNVIIDGYTMIGWNISPVKLVEDLNYVMTGEYALPEDEGEIKRFFSFLKASGDEGIKSIINSDFSAITFQVRAKTNNPQEKGLMSEQELMKLSEKIKIELADIAKQDGSFTVEVWGELLLLSKISKYLITDQVTNLVSTLIFVLTIVFILFRSIYYSIFSIIPLSFGVLMNFTIMSIFRIPLDAGTVMIGAIAVGVGIDNSIHLILNFRKSLKDSTTTKDAMLKTLHYTSRPMVFASIALMVGFLVFLLSSFKPVFYFGMLISISMFNCIFATIFILPSFLIVTEKIRMFVHKKERFNK